MASSQPEDGGNDAFVHISAVEKAGMNTLVQDQRVSYELETDQRGKTSAVNLQDRLTRLRSHPRRGSGPSQPGPPRPLRALAAQPERRPSWR